MKLIIEPNGMFKLNGQPIDDKALKAALAKNAGDPKFQLQIEADENLKYGRLAEVMALAQSAGVARLSFVTITNNR